MSTRVESAPVHGSFIAGPIVVALVIALAIGALAGSLVTRSIVAGADGTAAPAVFVARGTPAFGWDAQKLEAMEGRAMAERFRNTVVLSAAELNALRMGVVPERLQGVQDSVFALSAAELFALRNGELAERLRDGPILWDPYKLEAMKGRVLAEQVRAEDPPVKPHLPKRPPNG